MTCFFSFVFLLLFSSCSSTSKMNRRGISRIKTYQIQHKEIPPAFDGFRMAFTSDFHYKSILQEKGLDKLIQQLQGLNADVLLMSGDYVEGCENASGLFSKLAQVRTRFGTYGVMGNNDYEACHEDIVKEMKKYGMKILEQTMDTLTIEKEHIILAGIRNPFDLKHNGLSPTISLQPEDFVILLSHTPDYAEKGNITHVDLFLAGHTHGGQVTLFGIYAPVKASSFGQKFITGKKQNSHQQTMIITNGIGTSRKAIRLFAPSEIVLIMLKSEH